MNSDSPENKSIPIKPIIFGIFILACLLFANLPQVKNSISLETINGKLVDLTEIANQPFGPTLFIIITVLVILIQVPGLVMVVAAGLVYNFWEGCAYCLIACTIGTSLTFLISRFFLKEYFRPKLEKSLLGGYLVEMERNGIKTVALLRVLLTMAPPLNWLLGATDIRVRDYVIGTFIGLIPAVVVVIFTVGRLKTITGMTDLLQPEVMVAMVLFLIIVSAVLLLRKKMRAKAGQ